MILGQTVEEVAEVNNWFAALLGIGTVFVGLICIILLLELMHVIIAKFAKPKQEEISNVVPVANNAIENREELVAAISAALAEELGEEISAIRILSLKKID